VKKLAATLFVLAVLAPVATSAQEAMPGDFAQVIDVKVNSGQAGDYENHMKMFQEWYLGQGGSWAWAAFEITMGERTGQYAFGSFNHQMSDWDTPDVDPAASREQQRRHLAPYTDSYEARLIRNRRDLGTVAAGAPLKRMYQVTTFQLNPGMDEAFAEVLAGVKHALTQAGAAEEVQYSVFQSVVGSTGSEWVISWGYDDFASMAPGDEDAFENLMEGVYGEYHSDAMMDLLNETIASARSELLVLRPDLSMNLPPM
jgi:hypothetical protein